MRRAVFDLFATPKAVGIVTGVSSALAVQAAQVAQGTSALSEWTVLIGVGTGTLGWGIAWGTMRTRLSAQDAARKELKADTDRVAVRLEADNEKVALKVEEHTEKLRAEMRESAKDHRVVMDKVLSEVSTLSGKFDASLRETRQLIADHVLTCPAAPKPRKR